MADFGTIDISMTSMSSRMGTLPHTLRSLLAQSYGDLCINLHLSREPYLLDEGVPELSEEMRQLQDEAGEDPQQQAASGAHHQGRHHPRDLVNLLVEIGGPFLEVRLVDDGA